MATIHNGREELQWKLDAAKNDARALRSSDTSRTVTAAVVTVLLYVLAFLCRTPLLHMGQGLLRSLTVGALPWSLILFLPKLALGAAVMLLPFAGPLVVGAIIIGSGKDQSRKQQEISADVGILESGVEGEKEALELVRLVSGNAHVFTNLRVPYGEKVSETDLIVVAESGVTIIEVKNHKGSISGGYRDHDFTQRNGKHVKTFYNPIQQVATHAANLSGFLREQGLPCEVQTCVLFTNPEASVHVDRTYWWKTPGERFTPTFTYETRGQLLKQLNTPEAQFRLSDDAINAIVDKLEELRVKGPRAKENDELDRLINLMR